MSYDEGVSQMILKRSTGVDTAELLPDLSLSNLLSTIDGVRTLEAIARQEGYEMDILLRRVDQLLDMGLVKQVSRHGSDANQELLQVLTQQLSKAVGPIADFIIEDVAEDAGIDLQDLSAYQAEYLVHKLAKEFKEKEKAEAFYSFMKPYIRQRNTIRS